MNLKISFIIGLIITLVALVIGTLLKNYNITLQITGFVSVGCIIISGLLNGSFVSGDRYRANYLSETKNDRDKKSKIINHLLLVLIPNIIVAVMILILNLY